jgi:RNA polymerase sigma-70 factor (ECF subfamily)
MDDEDLLRRARRHDRDAFAELVTRYQDRLYTSAFRMLGNTADAADVVQETFLRTYLHLDELRAPTLQAWLYRVALNCCRDLQRKHARRPTEPIDDITSNVVPLHESADDPESQALSRELTREIGAALRQLGDDLREVIVLRDVNDLSYEEMAAALRIPVGTVKSRLSRARATLALALRTTPGFGVVEGSA